jgi:hypothetical protein
LVITTAPWQLSGYITWAEEKPTVCPVWLNGGSRRWAEIHAQAPVAEAAHHEIARSGRADDTVTLGSRRACDADSQAGDVHGRRPQAASRKLGVHAPPAVEG